MNPLFALALAAAPPGDGLPPLSDLERFRHYPALAMSVQCDGFAEKFKKITCSGLIDCGAICIESGDVTTEPSCWTNDRLNGWWANTQRVQKAWSDLWVAQQSHGSVEYRRQALARLRTVIGPAAYAGGLMPPPLPPCELLPERD